jgi:hypothetical protein
MGSPVSRLTGGDRQAPTLTVVAETTARVMLRIPDQTIRAGDDRVVLDISGRITTMSQQDWQQFVSCVVTADKQVRHVLDRPEARG